MDMLRPTELLPQIGYSFLFYAAVVLLFRVAGKRLAGQTTTFDLIVLISLSVAVQKATLLDGLANAITFVVTVFLLHLGTAKWCAYSRRARYWLRGLPCELVHDGEINYGSLRSEGLSVDELKAGLRKAGIDDIAQVQSAHLEETGQISAIKR